ncbi:Glycosyl transferases group 1 [Devosia crocina]|uniref:Glycosyl transferases group 1 n=1 Tax=Devosia crocina TaxID=429728 RepID=A0A1I7MZ22_9HYPH|nr:glycosyltransferase [Devosia crocina]SFV27651.1 Glycosyl transferases group 1 [Devosia crocina]
MIENSLNSARLLASSALIKFKAGAKRYRRQQVSIPKLKRGKGRPAGVYFLTPDYEPPSGGVRVIYRHVDLLNAAGIPAAVVHQRPGFRCTWFDHNTRILDVSQCQMSEEDLLVLPETDGDLLGRIAPGIRHVIFNQNAHLTWQRDGAVSRYMKQNRFLAGIVTVSSYSAEMMSQAFPSLRVDRIHLSIDEELFFCPQGSRARKLTFMPRRAGNDIHQVLGLLNGRDILKDWNIVALDNLTHREVAAELRSSRIFLAFTYQEGFGLPAAEAMACGNFVIGYHGCGGREFFDPAFSAPVPTGDVLGFAQEIENAVRSSAEDEAWLSTRAQRSAEFIRTNYTSARETKDVLRIYGGLLQARTRELEPLC